MALDQLARASVLGFIVAFADNDELMGSLRPE